MFNLISDACGVLLSVFLIDDSNSLIAEYMQQKHNTDYNGHCRYHPSLSARLTQLCLGDSGNIWGKPRVTDSLFFDSPVVRKTGQVVDVLTYLNRSLTLYNEPVVIAIN